jgi:hypothetical protein
LLKKPKD